MVGINKSSDKEILSELRFIRYEGGCPDLFCILNNFQLCWLWDGRQRGILKRVRLSGSECSKGGENGNPLVSAPISTLCLLQNFFLFLLTANSWHITAGIHSSWHFRFPASHSWPGPTLFSHLQHFSRTPLSGSGLLQSNPSHHKDVFVEEFFTTVHFQGSECP